MAARCPSCNQIYTDETLSFCPNDGTPLVREPQAFNPQEIKPPTNYPAVPGQSAFQQQPPPPQQGYYGQQGGQVPPQGWQQPAYGQQQYPPPYGAPAGAKSKLPLVIAIAAVALIAIAAGLYFLLRGNSSSSSSSSSSTNSSRTSANTSSTSSTPSATPSRTTTTSTFPTPSTNTTTTATTTSSSDDEKYRLFYAAAKTGDTQLQKDIARKIGIIDANGLPTTYYEPFVKGATAWATRDYRWVQEHNTVESARQWIKDHS
ncbi:MAG: hypothetical protein M3362_21110 [Acidobacteriota bacterium]|nr:hypothetical protein [Acidobacteriota bacterium]